MKQVVMWEANDGTLFNSREVCEHYDDVIAKRAGLASKLRDCVHLSFEDTAERLLGLYNITKKEEQ